MRIRMLAVLLVLLAVAGFAAINWPAFTAPTKLSLLVAAVEFPLGLLMLAALAVLVVVMGLWLAAVQAAAQVAARRHVRQTQELREVAERAEASRLAGLRAALDEQFGQLSARLARVEEAHHAELRDAVNSLAAMIGELDDRLHRGPLPPH